MLLLNEGNRSKGACISLLQKEQKLIYEILLKTRWLVCLQVMLVQAWKADLRC